MNRRIVNRALASAGITVIAPPGDDPPAREWRELIDDAAGTILECEQRARSRRARWDISIAGGWR